MGGRYIPGGVGIPTVPPPVYLNPLQKKKPTPCGIPTPPGRDLVPEIPNPPTHTHTQKGYGTRDIYSNGRDLVPEIPTP